MSKLKAEKPKERRGSIGTIEMLKKKREESEELEIRKVKGANGG